MNARVPPLVLGVCSWSLQVRNIPELVRLAADLGVSVAQIACGDPHHASWDEGDQMPEAAARLGPHLQRGDARIPGRRLHHTRRPSRPPADSATPSSGPSGSTGWPGPSIGPWRLGLNDLTLHAGFLPAPNSPDRRPLLDTLSRAGRIAADQGITLAFETGQESADLLRLTLDDLAAPNLKVNFDPANMLLYDMGDPLRAVEVLGPDIRSVHVKDARRPAVAGNVGRGSPAGPG